MPRDMIDYSLPTLFSHPKKQRELCPILQYTIYRHLTVLDTCISTVNAGQRRHRPCQQPLDDCPVWENTRYGKSHRASTLP
jgi:hypothetical protein